MNVLVCAGMGLVKRRSRITMGSARCRKALHQRHLHGVGQHKSKEVLYQQDVDVAVFDSINVEVNVALDAGSLYTRGIMSTSHPLTKWPFSILSLQLFYKLC